ncbi:MAG: beta-ketoacyl-ACP synthase [Rhizobiaceae bacterium]|nr:beta-ketoacyl-ACP synthase [Rhizobiaceae bacterium]MCV0408796.1 beta-ketoacyl-ACP synthase [Rhizobiaceae bacterium]
MIRHDVVITGIGIVSSLGEGCDAHWNALTAPDPRPVLDTERYAPYPVHPLPEIDWTLQIPKRGDQRQMETWQRLGTYTAGLALQDAGVKDDEALVSSMDMTVAAGGGERDVPVDIDVLEASLTRKDRDLLLNEKLTTELRPTLFLAQLSNLLAGNISIVHKVTGSSRTFMGEEGAGVSALEHAAARIRAGQSTHALVGAAFNAEHSDMLLGYELAGYLHRGPHRTVWARDGQPGGGIVAGSGAAFLVLEAHDHARAAGRRVYAKLGPVESGRALRLGEGLQDAIAAMIAGFGLDKKTLAISGASGAHAATAAERTALDEPGNLVARGMSTMTGHLKEAQLPFAVALAALAVHRGAAYPPFDAEAEKPWSGGAPDRILTTAIGYHRFEGAALVEKA